MHIPINLLGFLHFSSLVNGNDFVRLDRYDNVYGVAGSYDALFTRMDVSSVFVCADICRQYNDETCTGIFYTDTDAVCEGTQFVNESGLSTSQTNIIHYAVHITGFKHLGCMTDGHPRALLHYHASDDDMTAELCYEGCKESGYPFFGIEATHCYCSDDTYNKYGEKNGCNIPCGGDQTQMCGGNYAINVFGYTYGC